MLLITLQPVHFVYHSPLIVRRSNRILAVFYRYFLYFIVIPIH